MFIISGVLHTFADLSHSVMPSGRDSISSDVSDVRAQVTGLDRWDRYRRTAAGATDDNQKHGLAASWSIYVLTGRHCSSWRQMLQCWQKVADGPLSLSWCHFAIVRTDWSAHAMCMVWSRPLRSTCPCYTAAFAISIGWMLYTTLCLCKVYPFLFFVITFFKLLANSHHIWQKHSWENL